MLLKSLANKPEWPTDIYETHRQKYGGVPSLSRPPWGSKIEQITGLEFTCIYPFTIPLPVVIEVDANKPLEEVAYNTTYLVVKAMLETRFAIPSDRKTAARIPQMVSERKKNT